MARNDVVLLALGYTARGKEDEMARNDVVLFALGYTAPSRPYTKPCGRGEMAWNGG